MPRKAGGVFGRLRPTLLVMAVLPAVASCGGGPGPGAPGPGGPLTGQPPSGMAPTIDSVPLLFGVRLDTVRAGVFDQGKMWTFEDPPLAYLRDTYGFVPDSTWFRHLRLSALRIPGCSASFVSASGLILTNHHCAREALTQVTREGEDLLRDGFYARSPGEEREIEDFHADQLIAIRDVSEEVDRRLALAPASLRAERRSEIHQDIAERIRAELGGEAAGIQVEIVSLYSGARTSAHVLRRHADVRLVMAPELRVGYFGGDPDNFTYPRYNLDFAFLRVYGEDGSPLVSDPYLRWSAAGAREGELTFAVGNPGSTARMETVAQLLFRRDVSDRAIVDFVSRRAEIFEAFTRRNPVLARALELENVVFGLRNSEKSYRGQLAGLHDPVILARLRDREQAFQRAVEADSVLRGPYGGLVERMAEVQEQKRRTAAGHTFLGLGSAEYESSTLLRALRTHQYLTALRQAQPIALRNELRGQVLSVRDRPAELDEALIQDRLQSFVDAYGLESELARNVLEGRSPEGAAAHVRRSSVFADSARTAAALAADQIPADDPALRVVQGYLPTLSRFEQARAQAGQQEAALAEQIGRARFALHGTAVPPDASFSLRLADGVVSGYAYNGTVAPAHTTFYGLYERYRAHQPRFETPSDSPWDLPEGWRSAPLGLDLATPLNFVSTSDIVGGNSGSPVVNRNLEVVGVVFDGNVESLPGSYIYLPERARAVSVDVRGILVSLRVVYQMDRLIEELTTGQLTPAGAGAGTDSGTGAGGP